MISDRFETILTLLMKMSVCEDIKQKAFTICKQYLGGSWLSLRYDDFHIDHIRGGLSNMLYSCEMVNNKIVCDENVPRKVLLRLYGPIIQEHPETVVTDSVIYALLAEKQTGPKLYGVFPGGRVEEYVDSRHLRTSELWLPNVSKECARIMASFHHMTMPLCKEPIWLGETIDRYMLGAVDVIAQRHGFDEEKKVFLEKIHKFDIEKELHVLRHILSQVESPVVFCHNDMQEGNILLFKDGETTELLAIDFEYCGYNFRGFDIGNHFVEWCYNYHEVLEYPYFTADITKYPNREQQLLFIQTYIKEAGLDTTQNKDAQELEEHIMLEALVYALASHIMWGLWSVVQAKKSKISFGYLEYAVARFESYFYQKQQLPPHIQLAIHDGEETEHNGTGDK